MHTAKLPEITLHGATFSSVCVPLVATRILFELFLAGGARDAHWTGTNEDASVASVKSIRDAGLTYLLGRKPT